MRYLSLLLICATIAAHAERPRTAEEPDRRPQRTLDGPRLGLVFDPASRSLREAVGLPGAVSIGESLAAGTDLANAEVSPGHHSAIAVDGTGTVLFVSRYEPPMPLGVPPSPSRILYSPGAKLVTLSYPELEQVWKIRFENGSPVDARTLDVPEGTSALAISDQGVVLAAADDGPVSLVDESGPRNIGSVRKASTAVFLSDSEAAIADEAGDTVFLVRGGALLPIAADAQGVAEPAALAAVDNNRRVLVANRRSGTILSIGLDDGVTEVIECNCKPEKLGRTLDSDVFWLSDRLLFDAAARGVRFAPRAEGGEK